MYTEVAIFALQVIVLGAVQLLGILAGFLVVPVMLLFGKYDEDSYVKFTQYNTNRSWVREVFPTLLWAWDNKEDSSTGDKRGWWDANSFGADSRRWINRFWWLAVRNPFNNFKRYILGIDTREYVMLRLAGQMVVRDDFRNTGWQLLKAESLTNKIPRYMLYVVLRYGSSNRALVVQIGNKIKLEHNHKVEEKEVDYWKGWTFELNPFKDIS